MELDRRKIYTLFIVGLLLGLAPFGVAFAAHIADTYVTSGSVPYSASASGPTVNLTGGTNVLSGNPFDDANTVNLTTEDGNITFSSSVKTRADLNKDEIVGEWTNLTNMDVSSGTLKVNPEDKPQFDASGNVDELSIRDSMAVDDGTVDFRYQGASGSTTLTIRTLSASSGEVVAAIDRDTDDLLASGTVNSNGVVTLSNMPNSEHFVLLQTSEGGPSLTNPSPVDDQNDFPSSLSIDVDDPDFPQDNVTVEFFLDDVSQGSDTVDNAGTASVNIGTPSRGEHTVRAEAEDGYGATNSRTWTFSVPNNLTVRNATDPWAIINDREVTFTFYDGDDIIDNRSTSDGNVSLEGLSTGSQIVGEADAENFSRTFFIIEDITEQSEVYLIHEDVSTVEVRFTLTDRTGGTFEDNDAKLFIQKPVNITGTTQWHTVWADEFGVEGVTSTLEENQRYRLTIKNDQGDSRVLGTYTADVTEVVELQVGQLSGTPEGEDVDYIFSAEYLSDQDPRQVKFEYNDTEDLTDELTVKIHERGNESNVLFSNQTFGGPIGTISITENIPNDQNSTSWVVQVWGERDGEDLRLEIPVGPQEPLLQSLPGWVITVISIGTIWVVAGLFSQLNGHIGALVVAAIGGIFWYIDLLPSGTGTGVVILAMITAGIIFVNESRQGVSI